jgi:TetR/AcrR family fatty acid metabolism transcriptional regulator
MRHKEGNKREDIIKAAIKIFAENGYHHAKIAKVAEVANVATGSVYVYFENKEKVLLEIFDEIWKDMYNNLKELVDKKEVSPFEKFDALVDIIFDKFTESPEIALVMVNEQNHLLTHKKEKFTEYYEKFIELGVSLIQEGIDKGVFNSGIDLNIYKHYLLGAFRDLVNTWATDRETFSLNSIRQSIKYFSKYGLCKNCM